MFFDFNIPYPTHPNQEDLDRLDRILTRIQSSKLFSFKENTLSHVCAKWHSYKFSMPQSRSMSQQQVRLLQRQSRYANRLAYTLRKADFFSVYSRLNLINSNDQGSSY